MRFDRLEVSGGFLDGLHLNLSSGLNVLIGARGAGKTSVLELCRFALGVDAMTKQAQQEAEQQARAVLGDGTVSAYCSIDGEQLVYTRSVLDDAPATLTVPGFRLPLIVSQNEIEALGLDPARRREILDRLLDPLDLSGVDIEDLRSRVSAFEQRLERLRKERDGFVDLEGRLHAVPQLLAEAEKEQTAAARRVEASKPLQARVAQRSDELGRIRSDSDAFRIAEETLAQWESELDHCRLSRPIPRLPDAEIESSVQAAISDANTLIREAQDRLGAAKQRVSAGRTASRARQSEIQAQLKTDAEQLELIQQGTGEVSRRVSTLRQQLQEREGLAARIRELGEEIAKVRTMRDEALDELESRAELRFQLRRSKAAQLTSEFNGRIEVRVDKSGEYGAYEAALATALQGGGLQYNPLAAQIAERMSPRELVEAVEANDVDRIETVAQISRDRAVRLVAHLQQQSRIGILLAPLEDSVDFALLDGQEYKITKNLSMGQRCTVVLPLLLAEEHDSILLDQPEDHLDNAFIVETLVEAIRERSRTGQVIVATHNANIPVLGDARQVVVLTSDGRRGFVSGAAPLDADQTVKAITTLMEGGREAFARRVAFYSAHESD